MPFYFYFLYIYSALILVLSTIDKDCLSLACNREVIFGLAPPYYSKKYRSSSSGAYIFARLNCFNFKCSRVNF